MKVRIIWIAIISLGFAMMAGCNSYLKSVQLPDEDILQAREKYNSVWDTAIDQHKVLKGMDATDVYFSWGRPSHRMRTGERERWIYIFDQEENQSTRVVWLFFENGRLRKWSVDRGYMEFVNPTNMDLPTDIGHPTATESGK